MPSECEILFDHANGVYNSGEILNGNIKLTTTSNKTIRGISIQISGYAKVRWTERKSRRSGGKTHHYTVTYHAHQQYLNSETFVVGSQGGNSFDLLAGIYNHTFTCPLPPGIPTSCNGQYGEIKYEVIVTIDRPFMFDNVFKQAFTVIRTFNLNYDPNLKLPKKCEDEHSYCWCCCGRSGKINATFEVPFGGFAPGQKIPFKLHIENDSNHDVSKVITKFEKCITFESHSPSVKHRFNRIKIGEKQFGEVLRLSRKEFAHAIELPSIPPSSQDEQCCVRVTYTLAAKIYTGCCSNNLVLTIPITIGTVPIVESATNPANIITIQPTAPNADKLDGDLPPAYVPLNPPSYEDAMALTDKFEDDERDEKHKEKPFVPKYPMYYNFAAGPSAPPDDLNIGNPSTSEFTYGW